MLCSINIYSESAKWWQIWGKKRDFPQPDSASVDNSLMGYLSNHSFVMAGNVCVRAMDITSPTAIESVKLTVETIVQYAFNVTNRATLSDSFLRVVPLPASSCVVVIIFHHGLVLATQVPMEKDGFETADLEFHPYKQYSLMKTVIETLSELIQFNGNYYLSAHGRKGSSVT
jgi:hypothetical protein